MTRVTSKLYDFFVLSGLDPVKASEALRRNHFRVYRLEYSSEKRFYGVDLNFPFIFHNNFGDYVANPRDFVGCVDIFPDSEINFIPECPS